MNTSGRIQELFDFLELETVRPRILLGGRRNESLGHVTLVRPEDKHEFEQVLAQLPDRYLEIFRHEPYTRFGWNPRFQAAWGPSESTLRNVVRENAS